MVNMTITLSYHGCRVYMVSLHPNDVIQYPMFDFLSLSLHCIILYRHLTPFDFILHFITNIQDKTDNVSLVVYLIPLGCRSLLFTGDHISTTMFWTLRVFPKAPPPTKRNWLEGEV